MHIRLPLELIRLPLRCLSHIVRLRGIAPAPSGRRKIELILTGNLKPLWPNQSDLSRPAEANQAKADQFARQRLTCKPQIEYRYGFRPFFDRQLFDQPALDQVYRQQRKQKREQGEDQQGEQGARACRSGGESARRPDKMG